MCFSPQADVVAGVVIGVVAVDVFRHRPPRRDLALAALVPLLAVHSIVEAFVWWSERGQLSESVGTGATYVYLFFAFVVLPVYLPVAVLARESSPERRRQMTAFVAIGLYVSCSLLWSLVQGPVTATLHHHYISYSIGVANADIVVPLYALATCGVALLSTSRYLVVFGALNIVVVAVLTVLTANGLTSLWCFWAALSSVAIAMLVRRDEDATQASSLKKALRR